MTDKELLEAAAKAAGIEHVTPMMIEWGQWNPPTDDGDALRLAVARNIFRCHMDLFHRFYEEELAAGRTELEATRRAITRAAAASINAAGGAR